MWITLTQNVIQNDRVTRQLSMQLNHTFSSCSSDVIAKVHSSDPVYVWQISCLMWIFWHHKCAPTPSNIHHNDSRNAPYLRGNVISEYDTFSKICLTFRGFVDTFCSKFVKLFAFLMKLFWHLRDVPKRGPLCASLCKTRCVLTLDY